MTTAYYAGANAALIKFAANRWERAVIRGQIARSDVVPGADDSTGFFNPVNKVKARKALQTPNISPEQVERNRRMSAALLRQGLKAENVKGEMLPGAGPSTMSFGGPSSKPSIHTSPEAGAFIRDAATGPLHRLRAVLSTLPEDARSGLDKLPLIGKHMRAAPKGVDSTLAHSILEHEKGEAAHLSSAARTSPFASHLGVKPNMMEQLAARGDPEALAILSDVRKMHPSDARFMRAYKQYGGLPGRPLPVGGKAERNLDIAMAPTDYLDPAERLKRLQLRAGGYHVPLPTGAEEAATAFPELVRSFAEKGPSLKNVTDAYRATTKANDFLKGREDLTGTSRVGSKRIRRFE